MLHQQNGTRISAPETYGLGCVEPNKKHGGWNLADEYTELINDTLIAK